jgi:cephalosporin hydroxylase
MNVVRVDLDAEVVTVEHDGEVRDLPFSSPEAFAKISELWLRVGWDTKYVYGFAWMGRPVIQLPDDLIRMQEAIYSVRPDVIVETGVAHGGSLVFYASLFRAMGHGRVIGVDVEIRPHNRKAIEAHELFDLIELVEGDSIAPDVVEQVTSLVGPGQRVMVSLDSNHTQAHVLAELEAYSPLVAVGSYIIAADGIMGDLVGAPRSNPDWSWDNPRVAAAEFARAHDDFVLDTPAPVFNEGVVSAPVTYWPGGWLRRVR